MIEKFISKRATRDLYSCPRLAINDKNSSSRKHSPTYRTLTPLSQNRSQITIFVIVAILIVAVVALILVLRSQSKSESVPAIFSPVYDSFLECLEQDTRLGISGLGTGGGHIYTDELKFEPGSAYMPFSSQLDFYGNAVPYWYYVSGSNIEKEQVPKKEDMEKELARFLKESIQSCNLRMYEDQGYVIERGKPIVNVKINDESIDVDLKMDLKIKKDDKTVIIDSHKKNYDSNIGNMYKVAKNIYDHEQSTLFLENYGVDVIRNYAPVDGVEFSCAPKAWVALNVSENLRNGIDANYNSLKIKGDYYETKEDVNKYFVVDTGDKLPDNLQVNFLTSKYWPYGLDIAPSKGDLLIANPIGNQEGLGALGFCYVPYHFVYDVKYPVLIQIIDQQGEEVFQFPVAVVIKGNNPRQPVKGAESVDLGGKDVCQYRTQKVEIDTYDTNLNNIDADISFNCLSQSCNIGRTLNGKIIEYFPQCVNGFIVANAEGYDTTKYQISTNRETEASVILDKLYTLEINLLVNGRTSNSNAIISFEDENGAKSILYPEQKTVSLSEGNYDIKVQVYGDSSLTIAKTTKEQCYEVPAGTAGGFLGITKKECVDIEFPETTLSQVLIGGGNAQYYVLESELIVSKAITLNVEGVETPKTIEDVQNNQETIESKIVDVILK
ncbi:hypothetical protein COU57_00010 [Candidatus Pacearchaeota archaeon CG10_big_fil_rev_8_21_14_0_10_32_14]|nr:MAG: hypothetical protein COU57_00010 [Candidatus Pacearchaeota archaeon CG10_big_fil_rev_8_21_14_0_10_32_14]